MDTRTLQRYTRSVAAPTTPVEIDVLVRRGDTGEEYYRTFLIDDGTLTAAAVADGRTTWDERDLCAATGSVLPFSVEAPAAPAA